MGNGDNSPIVEKRYKKWLSEVAEKLKMNREGHEEEEMVLFKFIEFIEKPKISISQLEKEYNQMARGGQVDVLCSALMKVIAIQFILELEKQAREVIAALKEERGYKKEYKDVVVPETLTIQDLSNYYKKVKKIDLNDLEDFDAQASYVSKKRVLNRVKVTGEKVMGYTKSFDDLLKLFSIKGVELLGNPSRELTESLEWKMTDKVFANHFLESDVNRDKLIENMESMISAINKPSFSIDHDVRIPFETARDELDDTGLFNVMSPQKDYYDNYYALAQELVKIIKGNKGKEPYTEQCFTDFVETIDGFTKMKIDFPPREEQVSQEDQVSVAPRNIGS